MDEDDADVHHVGQVPEPQRTTASMTSRRREPDAAPSEDFCFEVLLGGRQEILKRPRGKEVCFSDDTASLASLVSGWASCGLMESDLAGGVHVKGASPCLWGGKIRESPLDRHYSVATCLPIVGC